MKIQISEAIFRTFPDAIFGIVAFRDIDNGGENPGITAALRQEEARIRKDLASATISEHPHIAPWREAYRKFGAKPKEYPSSIENLVRRVLKGYELPHINRLVDLYNTVSLRHIVPVGGEDLDKIQGVVQLTFAGESEPAVRMLGDMQEKAPKPGEVIYKDDVGAICRRWNWKEAERTKFTTETRNGFLVTEGLSPVGRSIIQAAVDDLASMMKAFCGGVIQCAILDPTNKELSI